MKKVLLVLGFCLLQGCGDPTIVCWYGQTIHREYGVVRHMLMGSTARFSTEVPGPAFESIDEMQKYIKENKLVLCGVEKE
jgi:hypothetical protein